MSRTSPSIPRGLAPKEGFRIAVCPTCGAECYLLLEEGPTAIYCARCVPIGKWASTIKPPKTARPPAGVRREILPGATLDITKQRTARHGTRHTTEAPMATPAVPNGTTERADYGDEASAAAPSREHAAVGVLRTAYRNIEDAIKSAFPDRIHGVPHDIEVELHRAQAIIVEQATRIKESL